MQEANFLRHLIDFIKERERGQAEVGGDDSGVIEIVGAIGQEGANDNSVEQDDDEPTEVGNQPAPVDVESPIDRDDVFIPPLQAKIEMMKKLTGVPPKDETLKQSQEQGGPEPVQTNKNVLARRQFKMQDMFDDPTEF